MPRRPANPASPWDYVSVMFRDKDEPLDPREWVLRTRLLIDPRVIVRDIREGRWRRLSRGGRIAAGLGLGLYIAAAVGLVAAIALGLTSFALLEQLGDTGWVWLRATTVAVPLLMMTFIAAWPAWIALGGADRATAVLRRRRTRIVHSATTEGETPTDAVRFRLAYWRLEIERWPKAHFNRHRQWLDPVFTTIYTVAIIGSVVTGMLLVFSGRSPILVFFPLIYGAVFAGLLWGSRRRKAIQRRLLAALDARACPDCAYSLLGLPGRPEGDDALAAWPGPRRCPECGSPWPALPPPVPGHS